MSRQKRQNSKAFEALCTNCGLCCKWKDPHPPEVYLSNRWCPHYNVKERRCNNYENRHEVPWCLAVEDAIAVKVMPNSCPYTDDDYETGISDEIMKKKTITEEDIDRIHGL